jgi:hypothetical protein
MKSKYKQPKPQNQIKKGKNRKKQFAHWWQTKQKYQLSIKKRLSNVKF